MRLVTFTEKSGKNASRIGLLKGDTIIDLKAAAPSLPTEMVAFLEAGESAMKGAKKAAAQDAHALSLSDVRLESPILRPPKILAVGLNYRDHAEEANFPVPDWPMIFNKQSTSAHPPYVDFLLPPESEELDYEGEMAVVIGKRCRRVPKARAKEVIAGYMVLNDLSIRDWQMRVPTMTMGKSWDTHCPMGPALVTPDEISDPHKLDLKTIVNGDVRQSSNTKNLVFDSFELVEVLSTAFTLEPGDVIATGTCSGVALWMEGKPWLKEGDQVRVEISELGHIEAKVAKDKTGTII